MRVGSRKGQSAGAREKAIAIQLRGLGHQLEKNWAAAIEAYKQALELDRAHAPESGNVAIGLNSLAEVERLSGDYISAERDYREALRISKKINDREGVASYTGNLAELALDREQWAEAESLARGARTERKGGAARDNWRLLYVSRKISRPPGAQCRGAALRPPRRANLGKAALAVFGIGARGVEGT
jgi:tetratricopeptide (TPR) repeat protein